VTSDQRASSLTPTPAEPKPPSLAADERTKFEADPVRDGAIVGIGLGFAGMLQLIIGTGEVRPQPATGFDTKNLLFFDRGAVSQKLDSNAKTISNVGLYAMVAYAIADPILSGIREKSVQTGLTDAIIYAESLTITFGVTNLSKIAVRRPRPIAYIEAAAHKDDPAYLNSNTDSALSFFSGHAAICGATTATATYLAFARAPHTARPWITLIAGTLITGLVSYERVRSGDHFPSDVIAGAFAGAGIGTLVPHFHRAETVKQRAVWVGFAPATGGQGEGGSLTMSGFF
jgi:undecaprenyl-diphosphatase